MRRSLTFILTLLASAMLLLNPTTALTGQSGRCVIEGFVVGMRDYPGLDNATVELIGNSDNERLRDVKLSANTGSTGKYLIKNIPYGDYTLRASAPGYLPYQIEIYMLSDTTTQLNIKLRKEKPPEEQPQ